MDGVTPSLLRSRAAIAQTPFSTSALDSTCVYHSDRSGNSAYVVIDLRRNYDIEYIQVSCAAC